MSEEAQDSQSGDRISFRLSAAESMRVKRLMEDLSSKLGKYDRMTQKRLFLEALDALERRIADLKRPRKASDK